MANKKISELVNLTTANNNLIIPIVDSNITKRINWGVLKTDVEAAIPTDNEIKALVRADLIQSGAGAPSSTPDFIGQMYTDTTNFILYVAKGTGSSADWIAQCSFEYATIDGTLTKVYTKYLTGTLDSDALTNIAHGVSNVDKILFISAICWDDGNNVYRVYTNWTTQSVNDQFQLNFDSTNVNIGSVGADLQGNNYRLMIKYYE